MNAEKQRFVIRASASRLDKGLLAIPQKFRYLFPTERTQVHVVFDDGVSVRAHTFQPFDPVVKESRILGLRKWFSRRGVNEGDLISITIENPARPLYRIALDRFVLERQEKCARQGLKSAQTDSAAEEQLMALSRLTKKQPREVAKEELARIAEQSTPRPRPTVLPRTAERHEVVPPSIRVLLRELHDGKCQICSFTFIKKSGEPYFQVHHLDANVGHHPSNLLVVCPNCHAQLEHATVTDLRWAGPWLVGVTINGKQLSVRQPFTQDAKWRTLLCLTILVAALRLSRHLLRC